MKEIGRITYVTKGLYDPTATYKEMDIVLYVGSLWEPKKETTGNAPPETQQNEDGTPSSNEWWQLFLPGALGDDYVKKTDLAVAPTETDPGKAGIVIPDGKTIQVENGLLKGTPVDFIGTYEELENKMESGEITDNMTAYIKGGMDAGESGSLIKIDAELSTNSKNAVENRVITNALNNKLSISDIDSELSETSENPVQNKILTPYIIGIRSLDDPVSFEGGAGYHNSIFRGKYLGESPTEEQYVAIADGSFRGLFIGDHWIKNNITWRIAHFNYWIGTGDTLCITPHVAIVPDEPLYDAKMNEVNTTKGGYVGSEMYKTGLNQAKEMVNEAFGAEHTLSHRELLVNSVTNGMPISCAWYDSTVELMNELMVYGSYILAPGSCGTTMPFLHTIDKSQFSLFAIRPDLICNKKYRWLRDNVADISFAVAYVDGSASSFNAAGSLSVCPAFGICA